MQFIVDGTKYEMVQDNVTFAEARAIEKITGRSFQGLIGDQEAQGSMEVMQALIWVSMKRVDPTLVYADLDDMEVGAIEYEAEPEEESTPELSPTEAEDAEIASTSALSD